MLGGNGALWQATQAIANDAVPKPSRADVKVILD